MGGGGVTEWAGPVPESSPSSAPDRIELELHPPNIRQTHSQERLGYFL